MLELLEGKVTKVLSPYKVVINLGKINNVRRGMKFAIYEEGEMIKDPTTGENLEKLELVKGYVEVTHVQEKISVAESFETEKRVYRPFDILTPYTTKEVTVTEKKALPTEKIEEIEPSPVKEGDLVKEVE